MKKITAASLQQTIAAAKTKPTNPAMGRTIRQNINQSLDRVSSAPATRGTGIINQKGTC